MAVNVRKLGEVLKDAGLIDDYQLQSALSYQRNWGGRLGSCLIKLGYLDEESLSGVLARQYQLKRIDLSSTTVSESALQALSATTARKYKVLPVALSKRGNARLLRIAISDPTNIHAIDDLQFISGCAIETLVATETSIHNAIEHYYEIPPAAIIEEPEEDGLAFTVVNDGLPEGDRFLRLVRILHGKNILTDQDLESLLDD